MRALLFMRVTAICLAAGLNPLPLTAAQPPALPGGAGAEPPVPVEEAPVPITKSPVAIFRELLAMTSSDRKAFLQTRPLENQKLLLRKLADYEALPAHEREWRLQATELRWYLVPLMASPATNRSTQLKTVPASVRPLVLNRLRKWDQLPVETRADLLENETALKYFTAMEAPPSPGRMGKGAPPQKLEASVARWRAMPASERARAQQRFNLFFELSPEERDRAIRTLSEEERRQIEKTLGVFGSLPAVQRAQCIRAFDSFAGMSGDERQQFLRNVERWGLMPPEERNAWRELVGKLSQQPPPPPLPTENAPMPPGTSGANNSSLATNR